MFQRILLWALLAVWSVTARAGYLTVENSTNLNIMCDTYARSGSMSRFIVPAASFHRLNPTPGETIMSVSCEGVKTRSMYLTSTSPNSYYLFNGQQNRTLNVSLYNLWPTLADVGYSPLIEHITREFQAQNPEILINVVMNPELNIYSFNTLSELLASGGFDAMELDMIFLEFLLDNNLITNPALDSITMNNIWQVGLDTVSFNGQLWGIPTWLCGDFLFSFDKSIGFIANQTQLLNYMSTTPSWQAKISGVFNGGWDLPSFYIETYLQTYSSATGVDAIQMPPDKRVVNTLTNFMALCEFNGSNKCIDGTYESNYMAQEDMAKGISRTAQGFLETGFTINQYKPAGQPLYVIPIPWATYQRPALYSDAVVTSSNNCSGTTCRNDVLTFSKFMNSDALKSYMAFSEDLPSGTPYRNGLSATKSFFEQQAVKDDSIYQQVGWVVKSETPFPNMMTPAVQQSMYHQLCYEMKASFPDFDCQTSATNDGMIEFRRHTLSKRYRKQPD